MSGSVHHGQTAISGAHIYLLAANTTGYGQPSVSLLNSTLTGASDSIGAYVTTASDGGFNISGDYICTANTQVYLYALGGNTGTAVNSGSGLLAVLGNCPTAGNFGSAVPYIWVNEVSTVAAAYAMAGFAADATHVSSSGTALAKTDIADAFANAANLVSLSTGAALSTTPAGNGAVSQTTINTLADILAICVNSSATCSTLLTNALGPGSSTPTDTATAAINIAHSPGTSVAALYGSAAAGSPFSPALTTQPNDFTLGVTFSGGGMAGTSGVAIDGSGDAWITNYTNGSLTELSSTGAILSGANGYTSSNMDNPFAIAIDTLGDAWIPGYSPTILDVSVTEISSSGTILSGTSGYTNFLEPLHNIAIDGSNNVWLSAPGIGSVFEITNSGVSLSGTNGYSTGYFANGTEALAIDGSGNAWAVNSHANSLTKFSRSGAVLSGTNGYTGGGLDEPSSIAFDASGNAWIGNLSNSGVSEFSSSGAAISGVNGIPAGFFIWSIAIDGAGNVWTGHAGTNGIDELSNSGSILLTIDHASGSGTVGPQGIAVDGSGDVWYTNADNNSVTEFIGAASPVVTPLAAGSRNNTLGTRP